MKRQVMRERIAVYSHLLENLSALRNDVEAEALLELSSDQQEVAAIKASIVSIQGLLRDNITALECAVDDLK